MPELTIELIIFLVGVGLFTLATAFTDLRERRIPNALTVPAFVAGLVYQAAFHGWAGLTDAALGFLLGFGTLFILWIIGGGGGGDVKLMGALSVWLGWNRTLLVLILSTVLVVIGTGVVLVWNMVTQGARRTKQQFLAPDESASGKSGRKKSRKTTPEQAREAEAASRKERRVMAYAIPVALATWLVVLWKLNV